MNTIRRIGRIGLIFGWLVLGAGAQTPAGPWVNNAGVPITPMAPFPSATTAATAGTATNWTQAVPNPGQIVISENGSGTFPANIAATYTYWMTNATLGFAVYTNNLPSATNVIAYIPAYAPAPWGLAPSNQVWTGFPVNIFYYSPAGSTIGGSWSEGYGNFSGTLSANNADDGAAYAVMAGSAASAATATGLAGLAVDFTNLNTSSWIIWQGSRLNQFRSTGNGNALWHTRNTLGSGQQIVIENDGCGYGDKYTLGAVAQMVTNNNLPFAGAITQGGYFDEQVQGGIWPTFPAYWYNNQAGVFQDTSAQYGNWPPVEVLCVTNGGNLLIYNGSSFVWNKCVWSYFQSPDGGPFAIQTNNMALSGTWGNVATGTTLGSTTNMVFGAWTNTTPTALNLRWASSADGTNRTVYFGYINTTITNGIVYQENQMTSMNVSNMLYSGTGSAYAMTNFDVALWKFSPPTLDVYANADADFFTNLWPTWLTFVQGQLPNSDVIIMGAYPGASGEPSQSETNQETTLRADAMQCNLPFYDGYTPWGGTNNMWRLGMGNGGLGAGQWHEDPNVYGPNGYWFYEWLLLQDIFGGSPPNATLLSARGIVPPTPSSSSGYLWISNNASLWWVTTLHTNLLSNP